MRPARNLENWNLPIRRTVGNWNLPIRRTLGDVQPAPPWQSSVVQLTTEETIAFLTRHPDIEQRARLFEAEVLLTGYSQDSQEYAIPPYGVAVPDAVFQNVIVFPDAEGTLHFTGNVPDTIRNTTNLPPFESPTGATPLDTLIAAAPWIVAALVGLSLLHAARRR